MNTVQLARAIHEALHEDTVGGVRFTGTRWSDLSPAELRVRLAFAVRVLKAARTTTDDEVVACAS